MKVILIEAFSSDSFGYPNATTKAVPFEYKTAVLVHEPTWPILVAGVSSIHAF